MMDYDYKLKAIRAALLKAKDKPLDQAVTIVADYLELAEGLLDDVPVSVSKTPASEPRPPAPAPAPAAELPPLIDVVTGPARVNYTKEELMRLVNSLPPTMSLKIKDQDVSLSRVVQTIPGSESFGISVAYQRAGDRGTDPCPKISFDVTDKDINLEESKQKILDQAFKIYGFTPGAVRSNPPPDPGKIHFGVRAEA